MVSFFTVVGLFKGFSGQLGSLVGMAAALVAGYFLYAPLKAVAGGFSWVSNSIKNVERSFFIFRLPP